MRIVLIFSILFSILLQSGVLAIENSHCPQWEEFVPARYANVEYDEEEDRYYKDRKKLIFIQLTMVGAPYSMYRAYKASYAATNNYWYKRRQSFEKEIELCNSIKNQEKRYACYMQVRQFEDNKTFQRKHLVIQKQIADK